MIWAFDMRFCASRNGFFWRIGSQGSIPAGIFWIKLRHQSLWWSVVGYASIHSAGWINQFFSRHFWHLSSYVFLKNSSHQANWFHEISLTTENNWRGFFSTTSDRFSRPAFGDRTMSDCPMCFNGYVRALLFPKIRSRPSTLPDIFILNYNFHKLFCY